MSPGRLLIGVGATLAVLCAAAAHAQTLPIDARDRSAFYESSVATLAPFGDDELASALVRSSLSAREQELGSLTSIAHALEASLGTEGTAPERPVDPCQWTDELRSDAAGNYYAGLPVQGELSPNRSVAIFVGYDAWRGIQDGSWENNGIHVGSNFGTRLGSLSDWTGIGFQAGASIGVFDWSGTDYRSENQNQAETQGFITYGFFRKAIDESRWSAALVQDWMINSNFSVFAQNPTLAQVRYQWGYATSASNEYGVWGAFREQGDTRITEYHGPVTWRPLNQVNGYWHHKWGAGGADTWLWVGVPERTRLSGGGSLGDYLVGTYASYPLGPRAALYSQITYMHPSAAAGAAASREEAWNFSIGVSLFPMRNARTNTVFGQRWTPQLPVASNGTFLVDASQTY